MIMTQVSNNNSHEMMTDESKCQDTCAQATCLGSEPPTGSLGRVTLLHSIARDSAHLELTFFPCHLPQRTKGRKDSLC